GGCESRGGELARVPIVLRHEAPRLCCRQAGCGWPCRWRRLVPERVCVAQIGAAHGIRGEVKLWSFTADPLSIKDYGPLESENGAARFRIESLRCTKDHLVVRFAGDASFRSGNRSEEHTSELQSRRDLVCRLLLEKKKK